MPESNMRQGSDEWIRRYKLKEMLGQGGMGVAYLAEDKARNNALCVVKQLTVVGATQEEHAEASRFFRREVDILRHLRHPGIVRLFDDCISTDQKYFLVMDYIPGNNLDDVVKSWGSFSSQATIEIGIQCCEILEYLHGHAPPIIYRDLKPGNLMLTPDGQIVFIDFGIARSILPKQIATRVVTTGYSPPEQYTGHPEPRSDLYALGATLCHLVTGVRPKPLFVSPPIELKHDVLPSLDYLIRRLTAHAPLERPPSARAVRYELYRIYQKIHPDFVLPEEILNTFDFAPHTVLAHADKNRDVRLGQLNQMIQENQNVANARVRKMGNDIKKSEYAERDYSRQNSTDIKGSPFWQSIKRILQFFRP